MQTSRVPLCAVLLALCWIVTFLINVELVDAAKSNTRSRDVQTRKNSSVHSKRDELQETPSEDIQLDKAEVEKEKPKSRKSPEEVLAGKQHF